MDITLKSLVGYRTVTVDDKATVENLKILVKKNYGIKMHEQELMYDNKILENNQELLKNCNIRNGSVINVIYKSSQVETHVTMPDNNVLVLHVQSENKVSELKSKIQDQSGIPTNEQVILHKGISLNDDKQLLHYNISGLCAVKVIPKVTVDNQCVILREKNKEICTLLMEKETKILDIKKKLTTENGIDTKGLSIKYGDRLLKDNEDFHSLGIRDAFTSLLIENVNSIRLLVKTIDGNTIEIEILMNETVRDLKKKIKEKLEIDPDHQKLIFHGAILQDNKTAGEYKMSDMSVIRLVVRLRSELQIFVKSMDGKIFEMEILKNETIRDLKKKIEGKLGIVPNEQKLIFQGSILDDGKTAHGCKISNKSVIDVIVRSM